MIYCPKCRQPGVVLNPEGDYGRCPTCNELMPASWFSSGGQVAEPVPVVDIGTMTSSSGSTFAEHKAEQQAVVNAEIAEYQSRLIQRAKDEYDEITEQDRELLSRLILACGPVNVTDALAEALRSRAAQFQERRDALNFVRFNDAAIQLERTLLPMAEAHSANVG